MSRLLRQVLSSRFFFVTCRLLPHPGSLEETEFECLARVVRERREKHRFLIVYSYPRTNKRVFEGKAAEPLDNGTLRYPLLSKRVSLRVLEKEINRVKVQAGLLTATRVTGYRLTLD